MIPSVLNLVAKVIAVEVALIILAVVVYLHYLGLKWLLKVVGQNVSSTIVRTGAALSRKNRKDATRQGEDDEGEPMGDERVDSTRTRGNAGRR